MLKKNQRKGILPCQRANRPRPPSAHSRCAITRRARTVKWQSEFSRNQIVVDEDFSVPRSWQSAEVSVSGDRLPALSALPKNVSKKCLQGSGIHPNAEVQAEVDVVKVRSAKRLAWKAPVRTRPQKPAQAASLTRFAHTEWLRGDCALHLTGDPSIL